MVKTWTAAAAFLLLAGQTAALAQTATGQAMRARRVREVIKLRLAPDNKTIEVALDGQQTFPPLKKDQTFTTTGPVAVTFERPNPLTLLVTAEVSEADDPDYVTVGKLIEAMLAATNIIRPGVASAVAAEGGGAGVEGFVTSASTTCQLALGNVAKEVRDLESRLFSDAWSKKTIVDELKAWTAAIDRAHREGRPGPVAIQAGVDRMQEYLNRSFGTPGLKPADVVKEAAAKVEAVLKAEAPATVAQDAECKAAINTIYGLVRLTNPQARLADVNRIYGGIVELKSTLEKVYANPGSWYGPDNQKTGYYYLRRAVEPSSQSMQVVSVKVLSVDYSGLDTVTPVPAGEARGPRLSLVRRQAVPGSSSRKWASGRRSCAFRVRSTPRRRTPPVRPSSARASTI